MSLGPRKAHEIDGEEVGFVSMVFCGSGWAINCISESLVTMYEMRCQN